MMKSLILFLSLFIVNCLFAKGPKLENNDFSHDKLVESGRLLSPNFEKFQLQQEAEKQNEETDKIELQKKSGFKAALFSAVIPGAGEYYTESYWRSAIFAAIEVVAWAGYFTYEDKGDTKDLQMRRFGDDKWLEQRYWTNVYNLASGNWQGSEVTFDTETQQGVTLLSKESIAENMPYLRKLEAGDTDEFDPFPGFTHTLPSTKTQQYYEMIYKYLHQFGSGWKELGQDFNYYSSSSSSDDLTPDVLHYRSLRNKSNDFYTTAKTMATAVLLNHLVSAFDAALSAKSYNKQLNYSFVAGQRYYAGERVNIYGIALSW